MNFYFSMLMQRLIRLGFRWFPVRFDFYRGLSQNHDLRWGTGEPIALAFAAVPAMVTSSSRGTTSVSDPRFTGYSSEFLVLDVAAAARQTGPHPPRPDRVNQEGFHVSCEPQ